MLSIALILKYKSSMKSNLYTVETHYKISDIKVFRNGTIVYIQTSPVP